MGHLVDSLLVVSEADGGDALRPSQLPQRAIVIAPTIAKAPAGSIEGQQRNEQNIRLEHGLFGPGLRDAPDASLHDIAWCPSSKDKRPILTLNNGKRESEALAGEAT
jgi:hypothetical protein